MMETAADGFIDVLMITYNRPSYVALTLPSLLQGCDERTRVWLWHNGDHEPTLRLVRDLADHRRVAHFHHSLRNVGLREPTNWIWGQADGEYVSKVDDDCLLEAGWARRLADAHSENPEFGVIAASRIRDGEYVPELAERKIAQFNGGHRILRNHWVQGSGYVMKRSWVDQHGLLGESETFTRYCIRLARGGAVNGWYFPLIQEEHMDDPRSPYTLLRTDEDLHAFGPLSARRNGVGSLAEWEQQLRRSALQVQGASLDLRRYRGWRRGAVALRQRTRRAFTGRSW